MRSPNLAWVVFVATCCLMSLVACFRPGGPAQNLGQIPEHAQRPTVFANQAQPLAAPALLGMLRTRQHTIRVYAGPKYTIEDMNGAPLATLVSDTELASLSPELFSNLKHMFADGALLADNLVSDTDFNTLGTLVPPSP